MSLKQQEDEHGTLDSHRVNSAAPTTAPAVEVTIADELNRLRDALEPFARLEIPTRTVGNAGFYSIRFADIAQARDALNAIPAN